MKRKILLIILILVAVYFSCYATYLHTSYKYRNLFQVTSTEALKYAEVTDMQVICDTQIVDVFETSFEIKIKIFGKTSRYNGYVTEVNSLQISEEAVIDRKGGYVCINVTPMVDINTSFPQTDSNISIDFEEEIIYKAKIHKRSNSYPPDVNKYVIKCGMFEKIVEVQAKGI